MLRDHRQIAGPSAAVNRVPVCGSWRYSKKLIPLVSEESSFFNHIITAERPPALTLGAVQGSAQARPGFV